MDQHTHKEEHNTSQLGRIIHKLIWFVSIGVAGHLVWLLTTSDQSMMESLKSFKYRYLIGIAILVYVPWLTHALRMWLWSRLLGLNLRYRDTIEVAVTTDLGAALTPTLIGGGPIKLGMLIKKGVGPAKASVLLGLGSLEDIIFYISGITLAFVFARDSVAKIGDRVFDFFTDNYIVILIIVATLLLTYFILKKGLMSRGQSYFMLLPEKLRKSITRVFNSFINSIDEIKETIGFIFREGKITFFLSISLLFLQWAAKFSILILILKGLDLSFDTLSIYIRQWLVWLTMIFIPTPGATGGAEASFYLLFGSSLPSKILNLIVSVWRFFTYYFILLSAVLLYQLFSIYRLRKNN